MSLRESKRRPAVINDLFVIVLVLAGWFFLQAVVFPRLGIRT